MKNAWVICGRCNGSGQVDEEQPHSRIPNIVACPQCNREHYVEYPPGSYRGGYCVAVCVPDDSPLPTQDSMGNKA